MAACINLQGGNANENSFLVLCDRLNLLTHRTLGPTEPWFSCQSNSSSILHNGMPRRSPRSSSCLPFISTPYLSQETILHSILPAAAKKPRLKALRSLFDNHCFGGSSQPPRTKKADVAEHPKVFGHVGLLFNESPGQSRVALHLVIRPLSMQLYDTERGMQQPLTSTPHWL